MIDSSGNSSMRWSFASVTFEFSSHVVTAVPLISSAVSVHRYHSGDMLDMYASMY